EPRVRQLVAIMAEMKEAKKGMRITLDWLPGAGTAVTVDGKAAGLPIQGEDFYRALLRIWLGDNPVQSDLKKALLGG
ncbi:MAG TPA: chalcone isomerase family protein, partial [Burkholderiales bacterium]|nr:chalcone isomerase family protein [Burkholderiales bacterium]